MKIIELHTAFCQYQSTIKNYSPTTIRSYVETLALFLRVVPKVEHIEQVSFLDVQKFFFWGRSEKKWTASTFITHHKRLNVFFKWAVEKKFIQNNPFEEIEKPKLSKRLPTRLTKNEAFKVIEMAANLPYPYKFLRYRNHAIFATFLYTGLRKAELLKLKLSDMDLENLVLYIHQGKGNKDRVIPLPFPLKTIIERYLPYRDSLEKTCPELFVSLNRDCGFTDQGLRRLKKRIVDATGIKFHIHMLRHTFATLMIEGGCDIYSLSKMMGHSDIKTTTIYLSASVEHLRNEINKHPLNFI